MKRVLFGFALTACLVVWGCKGEPDPSGKWIMPPGGSSNSEINDLAKATGLTYKFEFRKGGVFTLDSFGRTGSGQWSFGLDTLRMTMTDGFGAVPGQVPSVTFILSEDGKTLKSTSRSWGGDLTLVRDE